MLESNRNGLKPKSPPAQSNHSSMADQGITAQGTTAQATTAQGTNGTDGADFLVIGNITQDLVDTRVSVNAQALSTAPLRPEQYRLGGTVTFAAITALRLGRTPTIITRISDSTDLSAIPAAVNLVRRPSATSTTFANIYTDQGRVQYCFTPAPPIAAADIPQELTAPRIVLLGPIAAEITPDVATVFAEETLVGAIPQGWMRRWDEDGRVHSKPWETRDQFLPKLDVLILSLEDIDFDLAALEPFFTRIPLLILTEYRDGSTVYERQDDGSYGVTKVPPRPAREIDPTGAGDIFTTAFLLRYQETGDAIHSARFANVTASFGVEGEGISTIPDRAQVLAYMAENPL